MSKVTGLLFCAFLAVIAYIVAYLPFAPFTIYHQSLEVHPLEPMVLSIIIGIICGNLFFRHKAPAHQQENLQGVISSARFVAETHPGC